jgi:hypothetical protein
MKNLLRYSQENIDELIQNEQSHSSKNWSVGEDEPLDNI